MQIDVNALADELVFGAKALIDRSEAMLRAENAVMRAEIDRLMQRLADVEARAAVPGPPGERGRDGAPGRDGIDGKDGKDGAPGERGIDGKDGEDGAPGRDGERGADGKDGRDGIDGKDGAPGERGVDGRDGLDGAAGRDGIDGKDGKLPMIRAWTDRVHYAGDCVTMNGATWQAVQDTGHAPPNEDWVCLAASGRDGRSLAIRGTWEAGTDYAALDVVALNGGSFVALKDGPGDCPGIDWQLLTSPGKTGRRGEDGLRGERGPIGEPGPGVVALSVTDDGLLTLEMSDGSRAEADFYPVLRQLS